MCGNGQTVALYMFFVRGGLVSSPVSRTDAVCTRIQRQGRFLLVPVSAAAVESAVATAEHGSHRSGGNPAKEC